MVKEPGLRPLTLPSFSLCWCLVAERRRVRLLLTFLTSTGCAVFSCKAPSVDTAVWQRQGRGPGQPACWLYRPSQGAGASGTPSSLCSAHCVLEPPMEIRLILQTRPLSCLQCEGSARGHENDLWLNAWEWGQETSDVTEVDVLFAASGSATICLCCEFGFSFGNRFSENCCYTACPAWSLSSVGWWVSEGTVCLPPLPEQVKRELIFMGHKPPSTSQNSVQ